MNEKRQKSKARYTGKLVYLATPYSNGGRAGYEERKNNLAKADEWAKRLWRAGFSVIHPVRNTLLDNLEDIIGYLEIIRGDLVQLERCDFIFMCPNWQQSQGARTEYNHAVNKGIAVIFSQDWRDP